MRACLRVGTNTMAGWPSRAWWLMAAYAGRSIACEPGAAGQGEQVHRQAAGSGAVKGPDATGEQALRAVTLFTRHMGDMLRLPAPHLHASLQVDNVKALDVDLQRHRAHACGAAHAAAGFRLRWAERANQQTAFGQQTAEGGLEHTSTYAQRCGLSWPLHMLHHDARPYLAGS